MVFAGPYPRVRYIPTGGISQANLGSYLALPQVVACGGSWIVKSDLLAAGDFAAVTHLAREAVAIVAESRRARTAAEQRRYSVVAVLDVAPAEGRRWDFVALGEVMLRLDPGEGRISTTRSFRTWEGGGEYNVARGLARCFGMQTSVVTALADNPIGRLMEDLMRQGGVDLSHVRWVAYDGVGRTVRNGLNFTERGFGLRAPLGCSDRGNTAASQMRPGEVDWDAIFGVESVRR
jgi:hypothetical protein